MKLNITILILMYLLLNSCIEKNNTNITFFDRNSIKTELLRPDTISLTGIVNPFDLVLFDNYLLISQKKTDKMLAVFCLNENKICGQYINKGNGPDEVLSIQSLHLNEKLKALTLFDALTKKYIAISITELISGNLNAITSGTISHNTTIEQVVYTIDSCLTYLGREERLVCQNNNGEIIASWGDYKIFNNQIESMWLPQIYKAQIAYNEHTGQYALFNRLTDKVEFYENDTLAKFVSGPDMFDEEYQIVSRGRGVALGHYREKTRIAYKRVVSNNDYIMGLYSGQTFGEYGIHLNTIVKFDWKGKTIKIFELEVPVRSFTVDWDKNIIYGINVDNDPILLVYKF